MAASFKINAATDDFLYDWWICKFSCENLCFIKISSSNEKWMPLVLKAQDDIFKLFDAIIKITSSKSLDAEDDTRLAFLI